MSDTIKHISGAFFVRDTGKHYQLRRNYPGVPGGYLLTKYPHTPDGLEAAKLKAHLKATNRV